MKYNRIGRSGVQVSAIGLGTWNTFGVTVDKPMAQRILFAAREAGVNFLDTADTYADGEGESILGEFLQECNRDDFVVGTKLYFPTTLDANGRGLSRKHIFTSVHRSLKRLGTDYIDLLQCHRFDTQTPLDETVRAMDDLVRQGKILYWGASRFSDEEMVNCRDTAASLGAHRPISNQFFYSLLERRIEQSTLPTCQSLGVGIIGYSPLAQGVLTGKYLSGPAAADSRAAHPAARKDMWHLHAGTEAIVRQLQSLALDHGYSLSTMALAWCLRHAGIPAVLTGASNPEQIRHNAEAADVQLSPELLSSLDGVVNGTCGDDRLPAKYPSTIDPLSQRSGALCN